MTSLVGRSIWQWQARRSWSRCSPTVHLRFFRSTAGCIWWATLGALRTGDPWRARDILRGPAHQAALRVDETHNFHNTLFFGPTNVGIHRVRVEYESGEIGEALRLANDVDISRTPSLERKNSLLYKVAQCYECKGNDTAVFVHLKMAEALCPEDFHHRQDVRNMVRTLVKRAKPSYASEVRAFAGKIGLLD